MNPNTSRQITPKLRAWLIIGVIVLGIAWLLYSLLTIPSYKGFALHTAPFTSDTFSEAKDDSIYSYSGMSFYKTKLASPYNLTVLSAGERLPAVNHIYWGGDSGVLITFTDGGYSGSLLEKELSARGESWNSKTEQYVWYYSFTDHSLRLVTPSGLLSDSVYYSPEDKGYYFVTLGGDTASGDTYGGFPLKFFTPATFRTTTKLADTGLGVEYVGPCKNSTTICFVQSDRTGRKLLAAQNGKKVTVISNTYAILSPTNDPAVFIGIKNDQTAAVDSEDEVMSGDIYRIDTASSKSSRLGAEVPISQALIANVGDDSFYLATPSGSNDEKSLGFFTGAQDTLGTYKVKQASLKTTAKDEFVAQSILGPISLATHGVSSFYDVNRTMHLITPDTYTYDQSRVTQSAVESGWKPCFDKYTKYHEYTDELKQFKIGVNYDEKFQATIRSFAECAAKTQPQNVVGYSFVFVGLNPLDGRFVTD